MTSLLEFSKLSAERLYNLYVVELDKSVAKKKKFLVENPQYDPKKPMLYVGMSALKPKQRFKQHKTGYKANLLAQRYGKRLVPKIHKQYAPMPFEQAKKMEATLAQQLRSSGHAVWQR